MIRQSVLVAALAVLSVSAHAQGQERPPASPTRDATVGYHLAPAAGEAINVRVLFRGGGQALRVDLPDTSYMIALPPSQTLTLIVPLEQTAAILPWSAGPQALFLTTDRTRYTKKAEATIAGQRCTLWDTQQDALRGTVCITKDGLMLRNQFTDPQGRRNSVEAFAVRLEPSAETDFTIPVGFERLVAGPQGLVRP